MNSPSLPDPTAALVEALEEIAACGTFHAGLREKARSVVAAYRAAPAAGLPKADKADLAVPADQGQTGEPPVLDLTICRNAWLLWMAQFSEHSERDQIKMFAAFKAGWAAAPPPAPAVPLRMLTRGEVAPIASESEALIHIFWTCDGAVTAGAFSQGVLDLANAIQRKFCEVNGLPLPAAPVLGDGARPDSAPTVGDNGRTDGSGVKGGSDAA